MPFQSSEDGDVEGDDEEGGDTEFTFVPRGSAGAGMDVDGEDDFPGKNVLSLLMLWYLLLPAVLLLFLFLVLLPLLLETKGDASAR